VTVETMIDGGSERVDKETDTPTLDGCRG